MDCELQPGTLTALAGRSGSGKSTLLHALAGLRAIEEGTIHYDDQQPWTGTLAQQARFRRRRIGFVFQQPRFLDDLALVDNVSLPLWFDDRNRAHDAAMRALERLGVLHVASRRPADVSVGEAQRCGIARAIVADPAVVFADEPTASLDAGAATVVAEVFESLRATGVTLLVSSHGDLPWRVVDARWQVCDSRLEVI